MHLRTLKALKTIVGTVTLAVASALAAQPLAYPPTARGDASDTIFGVSVPDPYRWLEAPVHSDAKVKDWVDAQNRVTQAYLDSLPNHAAIARRVAELWNIEKLGAPQRRGARLFYSRNSGVQDQSVIYVQDGPGAKSRVLLDPNALKTASGNTIVQYWRPSPDGRQLLYTTQLNGGDWMTLRVLDVASGKTLTDQIEGLKAPFFGWLPDGKGIYYSAFDRGVGDALTAASATSATYLHRIGDAQSADRPVYRDLGPQPMLTVPTVSADGRWLVVLVASTSRIAKEVRVVDLTKAQLNARPAVKGNNGVWAFIGMSGSRMLFNTSARAPMGRIVSIDPAGGEDQEPRTVIPESKQTILEAMAAGDEIVVRYLNVTESIVRRFTLDGRAKGVLPLPPHSVVSQMEGAPGDRSLYYLASTMSRPATAYRLDLTNGKSSIFRQPSIPWNPDDYVIRQTTAVSRDGTRLPVTYAYRRDLDLKRGAPMVIMAYGGFGISPGLEFYESRFAWLDLGGVFAIAHTRGGAEYGRAWYEAGKRGGRVKTFEDFIAATEQLQREGVTTPAKSTAIGASNGGILVTAVTNMRPDLYAAVLPRVPMTEMIRFTRFTLGKLFTDELGDPDKPDEFKALLSYSPLHNIRSGVTYPAILTTTADSDDRVVPAHSFKYIAALQAADIGPKPHLLRVEFGSGHGQGKTQSALITEFGDLWTFAAAQTGLQPRLPGR